MTALSVHFNLDLHYRQTVIKSPSASPRVYQECGQKSERRYIRLETDNRFFNTFKLN